ncbi:MAG: hypothetical protein JWR80_8935 [Bradyrhizobium sp.]|nr:hypothetical protein [Bradyrhizobium sp.]
MHLADQLKTALGELEKTNLEMRELFESQGGNWKLELIRKRRVQAKQLIDVSRALTHWAEDGSNKTDLDEAKNMFEKMRRSIMMGQTEWPLSLIHDEASLQSFSVAARRNGQASEEFFRWIRAQLVK